MKKKWKVSQWLQARYEKKLVKEQAKKLAEKKALRDNGLSTANMLAQTYSVGGGHGYAAKQR